MIRVVGWKGAVLLAAVGLLGVWSGAALAQGPRPEPAPTGSGGGLEPEPVPGNHAATPPPPAAAPPASSPQPSAPSSQSSGSVARFQPPVARVQSDRPARVTSTPKKEAKAAVRQRAPAVKSTQRHLERAVKTVAGKASSPDQRLLLFGGIALLVLALGEALFLTLSVRFLRRTAGP